MARSRRDGARHSRLDKEGRLGGGQLVNRWVDTHGSVPESNVEGRVVGGNLLGGDPDCQEIAADCWCDTKRVWVPQEYPKRGLTRSCGTSYCDLLSRRAGHEPEHGERVPQGQKGMR